MRPDPATTGRSLRLLLSALAATTLLGCANPAGIAPTAHTLDAATLGLANPDPSADARPAPSDSDWWLAFGDETLNNLVQKALQDNPALSLAQARLRRAEASGAVAQSAGAVRVDAALDLNRERFSANAIYPPPIGGSVLDLASLQANASWELDFFGKNAAALAAALGQAKAAQADARAARGLLAANVALSYFQLARLHAQTELAQRTLAQREAVATLVRSRVNAGLDTELEWQQAASALPDARLQIEILHEQQALTRNALAALTAQPLAALTWAPTPLATMHGVAVAQTMPLDLLGRRSDMAAARWRVEAALQDVDATRAQFYPNVNLNAFVGLSSIGFDRLLQDNSQQWGVGPAIRLPLFDSGRLRAQLRGKSADADAAIASYNSQLLEAVHEVADRLATEQAVQRQQAEHTTAQATSEAAYAIALQRYQAGLGNYLSVLAAEVPLLAQRRQGVDLAARALDAQVQLLHAIGGDPRPATTP